VRNDSNAEHSPFEKNIYDLGVACPHINELKQLMTNGMRVWNKFNTL